DEETAKLFTQKDRLRITIRGDQGSFYDEKAEERVAALDFLDASKDGELPVPADGSGLTIGDLSENSSRGPTVDGRGKPEIVMQKNNVTFNDGNGFFGTSY